MRRLLVVIVLSLFLFTVTIFGISKSPKALAQGGPSEAAIGAGVAIGLALIAEIKDAIKAVGTAIVYCKAKVDGPDGDDRAIDFERDRDLGLDWSLDAETELVKGPNNVDDGNEKPYTPGDEHNAFVELHFESVGGQWQPDPSDCKFCSDPKREFDGYVAAEPDDDPKVKNEKTAAAAAAVFSVDGTTTDFCYRAGGTPTPSGGIGFSNVQKTECSPIPDFALTQGAIYMVSPGRLGLQDIGGGEVMITPVAGMEHVDLFHTFLERGSSSRLFPLLGGLSPQLDQLKRDYYTERLDGNTFDLIETAEAKADLSIIGAALSFQPLTMDRSGKTDDQLLADYLLSSAVHVIPPSHAQEGYVPQVIEKAMVRSGQDISSLVGRPYIIPKHGKPGLPEKESLIGIYIEVSGKVEDSVAIAINVEGSYVNQLAVEAFNAPKLLADTSEIQFTIPSMNFHHELPTTLEDVAEASPSETPTPTPTPTSTPTPTPSPTPSCTFTPIPTPTPTCTPAPTDETVDTTQLEIQVSAPESRSTTLDATANQSDIKHENSVEAVDTSNDIPKVSEEVSPTTSPAVESSPVFELTNHKQSRKQYVRCKRRVLAKGKTKKVALRICRHLR